MYNRYVISRHHYLCYIIFILFFRVPECRLQLCGDHIPKALHLVCGARYNRLFKRQQRNSIEYDDEKSLSSPSSFVEEYLRKLFIPKQRAVAVLKPHQKRGIVHECCLKPCCLRELYDYCRQEYITWSFG